MSPEWCAIGAGLHRIAGLAAASSAASLAAASPSLQDRPNNSDQTRSTEKIQVNTIILLINRDSLTVKHVKYNFHNS